MTMTAFPPFAAPWTRLAVAAVALALFALASARATPDDNDNDIPDVSALPQWPELVSVRMNDNPVSSLDELELMEELALLEFENTNIDDVSPVANNKWFRNGDRFAFRETKVGENDCPDILLMQEKNVNMLTDVECE